MTNIAHTSPFKDEITATLEGLLIWNQEAAILDTAELICELMTQVGITRSELATKMGVTKGRISQMLDGTRNMTLRTVSDIFTHLGKEFHASYKGREEQTEPHAVIRLSAEWQIPMKESAFGHSEVQQSIEFLQLLEYSNTQSVTALCAPIQSAGA